MVNNKFRFWLVRFGRTVICARHCIFNSDGQMLNLNGLPTVFQVIKDNAPA